MLRNLHRPTFILVLIMLAFTTIMVVQPALAAQLNGGFTATLTCTQWSHNAYSLVLDTDTSGTGANTETVVAQVTDGNGTILRVDTWTLGLGTYPVPANNYTFITPADVDPITLNLYSGNIGNPPIYTTTTNCAPTITSAAPADGTEGTAYSHSYTASGTAPITYSVTAGALPTGLTLSAAGLLSGTPTVAGNYTGTVTATNAFGTSDQAFNITIAAAGTAPTITSPAPADGTEGTAYSHSYTASGTAPITYSVTAGALPPGLTLSAAGLLSGTPTVAGNYTGTVTATNAFGTSDQAFNITIATAGTAPTITSAAPADGTEGTAYSHSYTASGTAPITYSVTAGALPTGLTLSAAGVLSGTPTVAGNYTGTVTATNAFGTSDQAFNITIAAAPPVGTAPTITSGPPAPGTVGIAYSHTFTATGNPAPTFSLTGALPPGLTFDGVATISGTPTTAGGYAGLSVTASNGNAPDAVQNFAISVGTVPPPVVVVKSAPEAPAPPPAPLCTSVNFDENANLRVVAEFDSMEINCRTLVENGTYFNWNGGSLTHAGQIGNQSVLDMQVIQAVDVFSPTGRTSFQGDVVVCMRGAGQMIFFNASNAPRVPEVVTAWTTPSFPGFTCATLYQPGTLVLVSE